MRYILALLCPPLAFLACDSKRSRAIPAAILFGLAIATASSGLGAAIEFFLVLWAWNAAGGHSAGRESRAFVRTVKPVPVIRE